MKSLKILSQIVTDSHENIEVYKRLLTLCGVKFEETSPLSTRCSNIKLRDVEMSCRTLNVLERNIPNFFDITAEEFCEEYPRTLVLKWRNLGTESVRLLSKTLGKYGYGW